MFCTVVAFKIVCGIHMRRTLCMIYTVYQSILVDAHKMLLEGFPNMPLHVSVCAALS